MRSFHQLNRLPGRIAFVPVLLLMFIVSANAYTIVMKGGRRIEIPSRFIVTATTLTYEAGPGIQITLAMAAIDIPASEKANNEAPGSLLRRLQQVETEAVPKQSLATDGASSPTRRTITNRDLEAATRRRRESELAYEKRRQELGLPSLAESRRLAAVESELLARELKEKRLDERESEDYWRARASALRTELAALDAEINYIRGRLEEVPFDTSIGSFSAFSGVPFIPFGSFGNFGRSFGNFDGNFGGSNFFSRGINRRPGIFVAPGRAPQITGRIGFGGGARRGQVFLNRRGFGHSRSIGYGSPNLEFPNVAVLGSTFPGYDFSYERSELITRFNELDTARAGLKARWRELEEEARRAGVPPGWLRP